MTARLVSVTAEIFGDARRVSGAKEVTLEIPRVAGAAEFADALGRALPSLIGVVVSDDGAGLMPSYTANLNGATFIGDARVCLKDGDRVFVFSSQAGG